LKSPIERLDSFVLLLSCGTNDMYLKSPIKRLDFFCLQAIVQCTIGIVTPRYLFYTPLSKRQWYSLVVDLQSLASTIFKVKGNVPRKLQEFFVLIIL
jgi:hypothetical protein